ncbi:hypothetical protein BDW68DRAFT_179343 [Aspergillus falconensis]
MCKLSPSDKPPLSGAALAEFLSFYESPSPIRSFRVACFRSRRRRRRRWCLRGVLRRIVRHFAGVFLLFSLSGFGPRLRYAHHGPLRPLRKAVVAAGDGGVPSKGLHRESQVV